MKKKINIIIALAIIAIFAIPITASSSSQLPQTLTKTYGTDAVAFSSQLNGKDLQNPVTIVSEYKEEYASNIQSSLDNGATLVAINLPTDNPLVDIPAIQSKNTTKVLQFDNTTNTNKLVNSSQTTSEMVYPKYWIAVIKNTAPISYSFFITNNDTKEVKDTMFSSAAKIALEGTTPHAPPSSPIDIPKTNSSLTESNLMMAPEYPGYYWIHKADLEFTMYFNAYDWSYAAQSIWQADGYDTVSQNEYWAIQSFYNTQLNSFECVYDPWGPSAHIGPYLSQVSNIIDVNANGGSYPPLKEYGPLHTDPSEQASVDIGLSVNDQGFSIDVSYGYTWTIEQVNYDVTSDIWGGYLRTDEHFLDHRDNYWTWLLSWEPCGASHNDLQRTFSTVFQLPVGSGLDISTLQSIFTYGDDVMESYGEQGFWYLNNPEWTCTWNPARITSEFGSSPSAYYVSAVTNQETYGTASISNRDNIRFSADGNFAELHAGDPGSIARIWATLNAQASSGTVTILGHSPLQYYSRLIVYVSNDNSNWHEVHNQLIQSQTSYWIECAHYSSPFQYLLIVAYDAYGEGYSANLHLDAVRVTAT